MIVHIKSLFITLTLVTFSFKGVFCADPIPYGKWKIYKYRIGNTPAGLSNEEIRKMTGKYVLLYKKQAAFIDDTCSSPGYKLHREGEDYFTNFLQINKSDLGIKNDSVTVISLDCETAPIYKRSDSPNFSFEVIVLSKTELVVNVMGVYFYLKKVK